MPEKRYIMDRCVTDKNGCWIWMLSKDRQGYGRIGRRAPGISSAKVVSAHRESYEAFVGLIPDGICVLHRCDVPPCCNPAHLFLGTQEDNMMDRDRKGRQASGIRVGSVKLTEDQVMEIRCALLAGWSQTKIAKDFEINQSGVSRINTGRNWRHAS